MIRILCLFPLALLPLAYSHDSSVFPSIGEIVRLDPRLDELLPSDARLEVVASGYDWTEGPVWDRREGRLLFSEIPSNSVMQWKEGEGVSVYLHPSGYTGPKGYGREPGSNGLLIDGDGRLISCEHGDRRVSILTAGGGKRTLADNYQGKRFNSPNDLTMRSNGDLYFTDPPYGLRQGANDPSRELEFFGVFLLRRETGEVVLLDRELKRPNGIALSPDERFLYVAQSDLPEAIIKRYPVREDGTVGRGSVFFDAEPLIDPALPDKPDGLKVDKRGNLWASGAGGIMIISPSGDLLGRLLTGVRTSNCAFGGEDGRTLYITADAFVLRVKTLARDRAW